MKKLTDLIIIIITAAIFLAVRCHAEDYVEKYGEYADEGRSVSVTEFLTGEREEEREEDELDSFLSSLPEEVADMLPEGVSPTDPDGAAESFGASYFIGLITDAVGSTVEKILPGACVLAAFVVVIFIMDTVSGGTGASKTASGAMHAAICAAAAGCGVVSFTAVSEYLKTLSVLSGAMTPLCIAMLISTGNVTSAGVSAAFITALTDICERVFSGVVLPMSAASAAIAFAESVFPVIPRISISSFIRKAAVWITVAVSTVASFIFGVQSLLSGAADTAGLKTVKFALGAFVPFVGGAVGDTVSVIAAGAKSVKDVTGVILVAVIAAVLLRPLVSLIAGKIVLASLGALSTVLGLRQSEELFSSLSSTLSCLIALTVSAAAVFLVVIFAFISYGALI